MKVEDVREFMDAMVVRYNHPSFLKTDPLQVPHLFSTKEDIEISAFLTATIAWGKRKTIIANARQMMILMDMAPLDFLKHHQPADLNRLDGFVHRTFSGADFRFFIQALRHIYTSQGGLESVFNTYGNPDSMQPAIIALKRLFLTVPHLPRSAKHLSDPGRGSAAKRMNMFLRWMVRNPSSGVDFGIWQAVSPSALSIPLDVHSGRVARKLGLLKRKQNDAKAVQELDAVLRQWDPEDPCKYDFALFGLGVFEGW